MKSYFISIKKGENEDYNLLFNPNPEDSKEKLSKEDQKLYDEIKDSLTVIKSLMDTNEEIKNKYGKYIDKILLLSQDGLVGDNAQPISSFKSLRKLKAEMILIESHLSKILDIPIGYCECLDKDCPISEDKTIKNFFAEINESLDTEYEINFKMHDENSIADMPEDQETLYFAIEDVNIIIKNLYNTDDHIKRKYFDELLDIAEFGLLYPSAKPKLALKSLTKFKEEIVLMEGQRIKNLYMKRLGLNGLIMSAIATALYFIIANTGVFNQLKSLNMFFITWTGAMMGAFVSFGARKNKITFQDLSILEEDMMSPTIRLIFVGISSLILLLFLSSNFITITIGSINSKTIHEFRTSQMIIGILGGLLESKLGNIVYDKTKVTLGETES